ncbi:SOS response-associated peptidase family protein [Thiohalomonas denitrificans]|uniref:SOS response-associated peptidase family protein n=1 Tax=Thiohalomonas denitrificans TaxID=415747 RepID=UPI00295008EC|nr:SOS response-associated peptidase family protein [Thiohalomonas denitrificans]
MQTPSTSLPGETTVLLPLRVRGAGPLTDPNEFAARIHNRMPVILTPSHYGQWLDPRADPQALQNYLFPYAASETECFPVSTAVNQSQNRGADVVTPWAPPSSRFDGHAALCPSFPALHSLPQSPGDRGVGRHQTVPRA